VAHNVEIVSDYSSKDYIHKFGSTEVLDTHMLNGSNASQLTHHQFTQKMQRGQQSHTTHNNVLVSRFTRLLKFINHIRILSNDGFSDI
jgi:hypothetical protein